MNLRYINKLGIPKDIQLTQEPLSIGRSREADISLIDDKVSRAHACIRYSDGQFFIKDLGSRNGVYLNGQKIDADVPLKPGDRIQIGATVFVLEQESPAEDAAKAIGAVSDSMDEGKGYSTILKEIVEDIVPTEGTAPKPSGSAGGSPAESPAAEPAPAPQPAAAPARPKIQLKGVNPPASSGPRKIVLKMNPPS